MQLCIECNNLLLPSHRIPFDFRLLVVVQQTQARGVKAVIVVLVSSGKMVK